MYKEVLYRSNSDWRASYKKIADSGLAVVEPTQKGILQVKFNKSDTIFCLSPNGMIQVYYRKAEDKMRFYSVLEKLLVPIEGETLHIEPIQQTITIPYPIPAKVDLNWCEKNTPLFNSTLVRTQNALAVILTICLSGICLAVYGLYQVSGIGPFAILWPNGYAIIASFAMLTSTFTWIGLQERKRRKRICNIGPLSRNRIVEKKGVIPS